MSTIHFVGGEKGGVGKSVVARVLAQYFIDNSIPMVAADADRSHGALTRYYGEFTQPVDLSDFASADRIIDGALGAQRRMIVDLPAQSTRHLKAWLDQSDVLAFANERGVGLVFWHVSDGGFDSVKLLGAAAELSSTEDNRRVVLVRNHGRSNDFSQLDESTELQSLSDSGGRTIDLPALDPATMYSVDRAGSSLWAAVNTTEGERALSMMERRRAKRWLSKAYAQLESLGEVL